MSAPVITVTRQYASGGSEIARRVAGALGWTVIDNEFVDEVARRAGLPAAAVAERDERAPGLLERLARTLAVASPEMFISSQALAQPARDEATIVKLTERVIAEAAAHGRVVLVGRGAQAILAQRPDALHVYVVASKPWRVRLAVERLGVDPAKAERVVDETDRRRDQYVRTYYGRHRQDVVNYDLVVNTERLGPDGAPGNGMGTATAVLDTLRLGALALRAHLAGLYPLRSLSEASGRLQRGLIGHDILHRYVVEIDYQNLQVRLFAPAAYRHRGPGATVRFTPDADRPLLRAQLRAPGRRPIPARLLLD